MTRVRRITDAADDLGRIVERIQEDNPEAARRVAETNCQGVASLRNLPNRGRSGLAENTRELIWPYTAAYEVIENQDQVQVIRIRHTGKD